MPIIINGKTVAGIYHEGKPLGIYHAGHRILDPTGAVPTGKEKPTPAALGRSLPRELACHPFVAWRSSDTGESLV